MIFNLIILLLLTLFILVFFAYIITYKEQIIQKFRIKKNDSQKEKNYSLDNNKKGIFNIIKNYFNNDYIVYSKPKSKNDKSFTVLSYNILAQKYLHKVVKENKFLEKKIRLDNITTEIASINPQLFCLQEATDDIIASHIVKKFEKEYNLIYHNNEGSPLKNVIGIKKDRFEVINEGKIIICDESTKNNNKNEKDEGNESDDSDDENKFNNIIQVDGNRGIINVTLREKLVKDKTINLFCVHFPWRPIYEYQKARIMGLIFDLILRKRINNVIIAGDFNSIPNSIVLRMVYYNDWDAEMKKDEKYIGNFNFNKKELNLIQETLAKMEKRENFKRTINGLMKISKEVNEKYKLRSAYDNYRKEIKESEHFSFLRNHPKYTNYTNRFVDTIDYIFYSKNLNKLKILKIPDIEEEEKGNKNAYLPNNKHPSDHLKLVVNFEYK
jgi:mRNA deadenylase 3'-5' endonuclease subunit Ccr4